MGQDGVEVDEAEKHVAAGEDQFDDEGHWRFPC